MSKKAEVETPHRKQMDRHAVGRTGYTIGLCDALVARITSQEAPMLLLVTKLDQAILRTALQRWRNLVQDGVASEQEWLHAPSGEHGNMQYEIRSKPR